MLSTFLSYFKVKKYKIHNHSDIVKYLSIKILFLVKINILSFHTIKCKVLRVYIC